MITAKLSSKYQAVVPLAVRQLLEIEPGDEIAYEIEGDAVSLRKLGRKNPQAYQLDDLVGAITPDNLPEDNFDDSPQGSELL
tara:strand:- start:1357 stop:1602 length:246 start_codon:yes stop_codon:yes gene_type:complete